MKTSLRLPLLIAASMTVLLASCGPQDEVVPASAVTAYATTSKSLPGSDQPTVLPIKKGSQQPVAPVNQDLLTHGNVRAFFHTVNP